MPRPWPRRLKWGLFITSGEAMVMSLRLFSIMATWATLSGGCGLSFEADVPEVEITRRGLKVPGMPAAQTSGEVSTTSSFTLSSSDIAWAKQMNRDVTIHRVKISAGGILPNLDFIHDVAMTLSAPGTAHAPVPIMTYDRYEGAPSSAVIEAVLPAPIDITALWAADSKVIEIQVAGHLPAQTCTVDVTLNLSGKITYKF
jgi:hypothetical protein